MTTEATSATGLRLKAQGIETLLVTADELDIGRGVIVRVHGWVFRDPALRGRGGWVFSRPGQPRQHYFGNPSIHRVNDAKDPTAVMCQHVRDAIVAAAEVFVAEHPSAMADAQRARSLADAAQRRETVAKLRDLIERLEVEAMALENGGREVYREHRYRSGGSDNVRHVLTEAGELLPSLPDVSVSGTHRYGPELPGEVSSKSAHETAFGAVDIGPDGVSIVATGAQLSVWADRWPSSYLDTLDGLSVTFDAGGLLDIQCDPSERDDVPAAELNAWSSDVLRDVLPADHPCHFVTVGQFA